MKIADVFFDLDHTLWDFEKNSALAFAAIFEKHGLAVEMPAFLSHYVPINRRYWELYQYDKVTQQELRYGRLRESFDLLPLSVSEDLIHVLSEEYMAHLPHYNHLFEGTFEILDYLQSKYRLHIITNGFHLVQGSKIANAKIGHYFQTITNSELAGVKKPDPRIFEYAIHLAKADKTTSIMIGDSYEADIAGALNFGIDAIFFNQTDETVSGSVKQVRHLLDLKKYL